MFLLVVHGVRQQGLKSLLLFQSFKLRQPVFLFLNVRLDLLLRPLLPSCNSLVYHHWPLFFGGLGVASALARRGVSPDGHAGTQSPIHFEFVFLREGFKLGNCRPYLDLSWDPEPQSSLLLVRVGLGWRNIIGVIFSAQRRN